MIISHSHRFMFIANGKTGTTSIESILFNYGRRLALSPHELTLYSKHIPAIHLKEKLYVDPQGKLMWDTYFKFAFVRNPWDWAISQCIFNNIMTPNDRRITKQHIDKLRLHLTNTHARRNITWAPYRDQHLMLCDRQHAIIIDKVGRFECLQIDFDTVCDTIGVQRAHLPLLNANPHKHYAELYDEETQALVGALFETDISLFGYSFI